MFNSKLKDEKGTETDLAFNTRIAYCIFKAEHVGEKTTRTQFIKWCEEQIQKGPFILGKKPNKSSLKKWRKRWSHDESAISYIIHEIQNRLSTADDKYEITILDLIVDDLKFIKKLYNERNNLSISDFINVKDYFLSINHIENAISTIEKRIRVRLELPTNYNNNKQEIEGNMKITQPGEENIYEYTPEEMELIQNMKNTTDDILDEL